MEKNYSYSVMYLDRDGEEKEEVYHDARLARENAKNHSREYGVANLILDGYWEHYEDGALLDTFKSDY